METYNSTMSIGTAYTPTAGVNKYITIQNAAVDGVLVAPQYAFDAYLGVDGTVTDQTTVISTDSIVVPTHRIDPNDTFVAFDVVLQVIYTRSGAGTELLRDTKLITIQVNTPAPAGMTNFQVSDAFIPHVSSFVADATLIETIAGVKQMHFKATIDTFNIPATGNASVKVALAL